MKMQGRAALLLLALLDVVAAVSVALRGGQRAENATAAHAAASAGSSAWSSALAAITSGVSAPHAANGECAGKLGRYMTIPQSDIAVRHNLIPGATLIFEVGGNIGEDLQQYVWKFPSATIFSYEPVPALFQELKQKFAHSPNVRLAQVGVSNSDRMTSFVVGGNHGEGSSHTNTTAYGQNINVQLRDVHALLTDVQAQMGKVPDVVSINCEGCEYEVLTRMAQTGWLGKVGFVQLSWHVVGGVYERLAQRCQVEKVLWDHYDPAYHALYGWQGWRLKAAPSFLQEGQSHATKHVDDDSFDEQEEDSAGEQDVAEADAASADDKQELSADEAEGNEHDASEFDGTAEEEEGGAGDELNGQSSREENADEEADGSEESIQDEEDAE